MRKKHGDIGSPEYRAWTSMRWAAGERSVDMAPEYGVHVVHLRQIKRGAKWT